MSRVLYFIEAGPGGPIKIGVTDDLSARLKQLDTGCPFELSVLATFPGTEIHEAALHAKFSHLLLKGEWFASAPELVDYIAGCRAAGQLVSLTFLERKERPRRRASDDAQMYLETMRDYLFLAAQPGPFEKRGPWIKRAAAVIGMDESRAWSFYYRKSLAVYADEMIRAQDALGIARYGISVAGEPRIVNVNGNEIEHLTLGAMDEETRELERKIAVIRALKAQFDQ